MKRIIIPALVLLCSIGSNAQNANTADELIKEGIKLHDEGKYAEAISAYSKALQMDVNNTEALYELSYTCYMAGKYDSAILLSNKLLSMDAPENVLKNVYVTLGSVYDDIKQSDKAEATYKEGIKKFPAFHLLYFNLGVTYLYENPSKQALALDNFQKAVTLKPLHAGSNYWQYKILAKQNKIPALLAAMTLCIAEQNTKRSAECAAFIQSALTPDTKSDSSKKNITIYLPSSSLSKAKENNFSTAELGLSLMAASPDVMDTLQLDNSAKKLNFQLQALCNFLSEGKKNKGFYWKFYAPFFSELKQKDYLNTLINIILMNTDKDAAAWVTIHQPIVDGFYNWAKNFTWAKP